MKYIYSSFVFVLLLASCSRTELLTKTHDKSPNQVTYQQKAVIPTPELTAPSSRNEALGFEPRDYYLDAYNKLQAMLNGQGAASFKEAVFITENAWYDNKLSYDKYNAYIKALAEVCKAWKRANPLNSYKESDSLQIALSGAVYKAMTDTLKDEKGKVISVPYSYNFNDAFADKYWADRFVTNLMATHTGNCHSLPFLYKIVAEELHIPAYLSFMPEHIYIKQYSKQYNWYNTELTSKTFPVDAWLMASGYVSTESIVSGTYMDTLGLKQSIVVCLNDLAKGYQREFATKGAALSNEDMQFVVNCCNLGLQYYPNYAELLLLKAETLKKLYLADKGHYDEMEESYAQLTAIDYREIPDGMYYRWMGSLVKGDTIWNRKADSLIKPFNPFASIGQKPKGYLTLSNGYYDENFVNDTLRRIGSVVFNTVTNKIEHFIENNETVYGTDLERPSENSRFLSVDPIASKYPMLTPYQYASDRPIDGKDLDGKEWEATVAVWAAIAWNNFTTDFKSDIANTVEGSTGTADYNKPEVPTAVQTNLNAQQATVGEAGVVTKTSEVLAVTASQAPLIIDPGAALMEDAAFDGADAAIGVFEKTRNSEMGFFDEGSTTSSYEPGDYSNIPDPKNTGPGKNFTPAQRKAIIEENKARNGGQLKSDLSGENADAAVQSKKGVKANMNQAEVDHKIPKSKGGTNKNSNAQVLTKKENIKKGNKTDTQK